MLIRDYELLEELGRGRFGVVSKCKSRLTGEIFAVKSIDKSLVSDDLIDKQSLINEPKALHLVSLSSTSSSSCHVTRLHSTYETPSHLHLILDFFPFPSLYAVVSVRHRIPEPESRSIVFSLLQGILHCHQNGVVHRDIKPENVLLDPNTKRVKLCDFGSSGFVFNEGKRTLMNEVVGTPYYVAPEILQGIGVFGTFSPAVKDLLRRMLCKDVSRRFSAEEALRHPWFMASGAEENLRQ